MSFNLNTVTVGGYMTADPELRYSRDGKAWATFTVAINDGPEGTEATFVPCKAFDSLAETVSKYVAKGDPLIVLGRIQQERWEGEKGDPRSRLVLVAVRVQFLPRKGTEGPQEAPAESTPNAEEPEGKGGRKGGRR